MALCSDRAWSDCQRWSRDTVYCSVTSGVQSRSLGPIRRPHPEKADYPPASCSVLQKHRNAGRIGSSDSSTRGCEVQKYHAVDLSQKSGSFYKDILNSQRLPNTNRTHEPRQNTVVEPYENVSTSILLRSHCRTEERRRFIVHSI
ncbi:3-ketoacyl-CoA thiolase [Pseudozyma hubeiensis SY62]|uniref:3-ketoacyl-CoA thiolase n=1 Tax=Pseudozyma hubeiensis (strain SY62) TaxID=1305764 RepID=R9NXC8_PSEHS|nr:3-ketoacyl-CoA thiolase [Pseudozyma hubeiensis SY62]GAC93202.1 3-ketoacyl-CoA thiolase [Pseudozyma hubeiensis SY62]